MKHIRRACLLAVVALSTLAGSVTAQEFTWTSATTMKLGSLPGIVARMLGSGKEYTETSYLAGHRMRTDASNVASIIDADEGRFTTLNLKDRSYSTMTFEEMAAQLDEAARKAKQERDKERAKEPAAGDAKVNFDIDVKPTSERTTVAGIDAKRYVITLLMKAEVAPEAGQKREEVGSMAFVIDTWNAASAPHASAMKSFQEAYAKRMQRDMPGQMASLKALFNQYPGMEDGWEAAYQQLRKVEGISVRSTTYIVTVPPGMKLDTEALFAAKPEPAKESAGSKLGRGLVGGLKAAAGRPEEEKAAERPAQQVMLLSLTNELRELRAGGVPADAFSVPAGYKLKK